MTIIGPIAVKFELMLIVSFLMEEFKCQILEQNSSLALLGFCCNFFSLIFPSSIATNLKYNK